MSDAPSAEPARRPTPRSAVVHIMPDGTAYSGSDQWQANITLLDPGPAVG